MTETELLRDLAQAVLRYDATIEAVARQRGLSGGSKTGAWSVDGALGEQLDAQYFNLMAKARAALQRVGASEGPLVGWGDKREKSS